VRWRDQEKERRRRREAIAERRRLAEERELQERAQRERPSETAPSLVDALPLIVEGPAPQARAAAPEVEAPEVEAPAPEVEAPAPEVETEAPEVEAPAPEDAAPMPGVRERGPEHAAGPPQARERGPEAPIQIQGLTHRWGETTALDGVSFAVPRGAVCGLVGADGAGKTTLLRIAATLVSQTGGSIWVEGHDTATERPAVRRAIGFVPDVFGLYEDMRVWEYLDFFGAAYGLTHHRRATRIDGLLELVHLSGLRNEHIESLSRGMAQRLCLARALIHDPSVLLVDEPATALEPRDRVELRDLLAGLVGQGITTLISSHVLSDVADVCTHVVTLEHGRVTSAGRLDELATSARAVGRLRLVVLADEAAARRLLESAEAVVSVTGSEGRLMVGFTGGDAQAAALLDRLMAAGIPVSEFTPERETGEGTR
jgi:ABC-2 type transport system ATP-binding protein